MTKEVILHHRTSSVPWCTLFRMQCFLFPFIDETVQLTTFALLQVFDTQFFIEIHLSWQIWIFFRLRTICVRLDWWWSRATWSFICSPGCQNAPFQCFNPSLQKKKRYLLLLLIVPINTLSFLLDSVGNSNLIDNFKFLVSFLKWTGMPEGNIPNHRFFNEDSVLFSSTSDKWSVYGEMII